MFAGNGLLRTLIVALTGGRGGQGGRARAGWRGQARACPASHTGEPSQGRRALQRCASAEPKTDLSKILRRQPRAPC